ncbi:MAG: DUF5050 domain-containing protein [Clostridiales bacterium]|nr:DUF5050 domain-containing protein [Clostridiales bacterium]
MNTNKYELKKLFLHHKLLYLVIGFQIIAFILFALKDKPINTNIENNLEGYTYYMNQAEGKITKKTSRFFDDTSQNYEDMESEFQTIYQKVSDGNITMDAYRKRIKELKQCLERKNGFLVLYDQYTEAKENKTNRYLLNTNAWDALLSDESLDIPLVIFIIIIACVCFGVEIYSEMDIMLRISQKGERKLGLFKLLIVIMLSVISVIFEYFIRIAFLQVKYGFTHGEYPLQSLTYFKEYVGNVSLFEASIGIFLWKVLGCIMWSVIISALMIWFRKYALTVIVSLAGIILSYVGISIAHIKYYIPGPLGALLGTGFYRGNCYEMSEYSEEKIYSFLQLSEKTKNIILGIDVLLIFILSIYVIYKYSNCWFSMIRFKKKVIPSIVIFVLGISTMTGCAPEDKTHTYIFNLANSQNYETEKYLLYQESRLEETNFDVVVVKDKNTGETTDLVKDPYRDNKEIVNAFYADEQYAYYLEKTKDREDKYFSKEYDEISLMQVRLEDFSVKKLFSCSIKTTKKDIFGINKHNNENYSIYNCLLSFFVYENTFYFVTSDGEVYGVNLMTGSRKLLFICDKINLSFSNGVFFYTNTISQLVEYKVGTEESIVHEDIIADEFIINENHIVYKDRTNNNALTCTDFEGQNKVVICKEQVYFCVADQSHIYYEDAGKDEVLHKVDFTGKVSKDIKSAIKGRVYVFDNYEKIIFDDYDGGMKEVNK